MARCEECGMKECCGASMGPELEELRAAVVWAVLNRAYDTADGIVFRARDKGSVKWINVTHDGTAADILRAVREAMEK